MWIELFGFNIFFKKPLYLIFNNIANVTLVDADWKGRQNRESK